jgi:hypothetical protein
MKIFLVSFRSQTYGTLIGPIHCEARNKLAAIARAGKSANIKIKLKNFLAGGFAEYIWHQPFAPDVALNLESVSQIG